MQQKYSQKYQFQLNNQKLVASPLRYKGFNRIYQLNLSKMLLKCPKSSLPKLQKESESNELMIVNTTQNLTHKQSIELGNIKFSPDIKNKLSFKKKKSYLKSKMEESKRNEIKSQPTNSKKKNFVMKSQINEELRNPEPLTANFVQLYINEKKMHESSFDGSQRKNIHLKSIHAPVSNYKQSYIKQRKSKGSQLALPDLKDEKKSNPFKNSIPLLIRDSQQLKMIKSECYAILQHPENIIVASHRASHSYQIASLTKIMTFYCIQKIASTNRIDLSKSLFKIPDQAMDIPGTSADLLGGEVYTLEQLLYGLMLPSGNDAAICLAEWGGSFIENEDDSKMRVKAFVNEMNKTAKELGLMETRYGNAHGLPHHESRSTALEVGRLSSICLKDDFFRKVVQTEEYSCRIRTKNGKKRLVVWENTNKLLRRQGFIGIKTGITVTAGPCLASAFQFRDQIYILVLLRSTKISRRFKQTRYLLFWALDKIYKNKLKEGEGKVLANLKKNMTDIDSDYSEDEQQFNYNQSDKAEYKKRCHIIKYQM